MLACLRESILRDFLPGVAGTFFLAYRGSHSLSSGPVKHPPESFLVRIAPLVTIVAGLTAGLLVGQSLLPPPQMAAVGFKAAETQEPLAFSINREAPDSSIPPPVVVHSHEAAILPVKASTRLDSQPVIAKAVLVNAPDSESLPAWQRFSAAVQSQGGPMIAIVIDDLGLNIAGTQRAVELPEPLTLSFLTYARDLAVWSHKARKAGHELLLHVPMEPLDGSKEPGPKALKTGLTPGELQSRLDWGMAQFDGFVGINNHMGSRFTRDAKAMAQVMEALHNRGYLFLDSMTIGSSQGWRTAAAAGVPYAVRDVFLDDLPGSRLEVRRQLARLERIARRQGHAIAIGHPHDATLTELRDWLPEARARGFELVPVSAIVRRGRTMASSDVADSG